MAIARTAPIRGCSALLALGHVVRTFTQRVEQHDPAFKHVPSIGKSRFERNRPGRVRHDLWLGTARTRTRSCRARHSCGQFRLVIVVFAFCVMIVLTLVMHHLFDLFRYVGLREPFLFLRIVDERNDVGEFLAR